MGRRGPKPEIKKSFGAPAVPQRPRVEIARTHSRTVTGFQLQLPLWQIAVVTGAPALFLAAKHRRRHRRRRMGLCVRCGYDLRATRQQCPECGALSDYSDWERST
jgi:hypothetical protein